MSYNMIGYDMIFTTVLQWSIFDCVKERPWHCCFQNKNLLEFLCVTVREMSTSRTGVRRTGRDIQFRGRYLDDGRKSKDVGINIIAVYF
jgi:hypothetical protein